MTTSEDLQRIKAEIEANRYETPEKIDATIDAVHIALEREFAGLRVASPDAPEPCNPVGSRVPVYINGKLSGYAECIESHDESTVTMTVTTTEKRQAAKMSIDPDNPLVAVIEWEDGSIERVSIPCVDIAENQPDDGTWWGGMWMVVNWRWAVLWAFAGIVIGYMAWLTWLAYGRIGS